MRPNGRRDRQERSGIAKHSLSQDNQRFSNLDATGPTRNACTPHAPGSLSRAQLKIVYGPPFSRARLYASRDWSLATKARIRGRVSAEEAVELREEGIETVSLPPGVFLDEGIQ